MLKSKYKAFEIQDDKVSETVMDGNLIAIADFIKNCKEGSIITIHTLDVNCRILPQGEKTYHQCV